MSHVATQWAWKMFAVNKGLASTRRIVLLALAECHNSQTGRCDPSMSRLHEMTGLKVHTIVPAIRDLESCGLIHVTRAFGKGSSYTLKPYAENGTAESGIATPTTAENGIAPMPKTAELPMPKTAYKPGIEPGRNQESTTTSFVTREAPQEDKQPEGTSSGGEGTHQGEPAKQADSAKPKVKIPKNWQPDERCWELLEQAGIGREFAEPLLGEFRLYWEDRGEKRPGWNATFLKHVKAQWIRQQERPQGGTNITPLRPMAAHTQSGRGDFRTWGEQRQQRNIAVALDWANQSQEDYIDAR